MTVLHRASKKRFSLILALSAAVAGVSSALLAAPSGGELEKQRPKWKIDKIPEAPILSPAEAIKTFKLPPGFKIELVAAEPMVEEPIAMAFDPDGRAYVCELRAYMPDMEGTGELEPIGRIKRLEDTDNDGVFDKSTIFMDKLSIPRAVGFMGDGVLVSEPPNLYLAKDTNGDGVADTKTTILTNYASKNANPEHMANGLVWMMDNWNYSAKHPERFRMVGGKLVKEGTVARGQWGIAQDDYGRIYYNSNSSMLHLDVMPSKFLTGNPFVASPAGVNFKPVDAKTGNAVFPGRVTPGVNRGYTDVLNLQGVLQKVTAACAPQVYRGDAFPAEYQGNIFVAEPSGNLIVRHTAVDKGLGVQATSVQHDGTSLGFPKVDFLVSTDERFRPVSIYNGPDGAIYVVDLYHGILQHKAYLSAYLADQVKQRELDKNGGHRGRIWRIVPEGYKQPAKQPKLSTASSAELAAALSHANGWWRDTAQRLLVERNDAKIVPTLQRIALGKEPGVTKLAQIHALWTLQGMDRLEDEVVASAMKDKDAKVRLQALRAAETHIRKLTGIESISMLPELANDPDLAVRVQVLAYVSPNNVELQPVANKIIAQNLSDPIVRSVALSAAAGRELDLLKALLTDKGFESAPAKDKQSLFNDLAECVVRGRSAERIDQLFALIAEIPEKLKSDRQAIVQGVADAVAPDPKSKSPKRKLRLAKEPAGLTQLSKSSDKKIASLAALINDGLTWPNKPGDTTPPLKPLTSEQQERFAAGRELYAQLCGVCHQPSGMGQDGLAPALLDSEWVLGSPARTSRIVLHGVTGPIKVGKKTFEGEMPGLQALSDDQVASILTYVRREWGHEADPVDPTYVAKVRKETEGRGEQQWTAEELNNIK